MKILIITQDDPFYLPDALSCLFKNLPTNHQVVGTVLLNGSVRGKKQSLIQKAFDSLKIFGFGFFLHYAVRYIIQKMYTKRSIRKLLHRNKIPLIELENSINHESSLQKLKSYNPDLLVYR